MKRYDDVSEEGKARILSSERVERGDELKKWNREIWREDLSEFIEFEMIRRKLRPIGGIHRFAHCNELFDERIKGFAIYLLNLTPIHKERYRFTSISLCMKNKISIVI